MMNQKEVVRWLSRGENIVTEIETLENEKQAALDFATKMTKSNNDRVSSSRGRGNESALISVADYSGLIDKQIAKLCDLRNEISTVIYMVDESVLRQLLINRYICMLTWEMVAETMNYSYFHVHGRLAPKAYRAVSEILSTYEK